MLVLPGLGTVEDLREVHGVGAEIARVATHCTEADVSLQHFAAARELGMETVGFLMLSHRIGPDELAKQARIMADAGCQCVYVVDSAGALLPDVVRDRVQALVAELGADAQVGFHGHQNLSLGVANSIVAYENGRPADRRHAVRVGRRRRQLADRDPGHRLRLDGHPHRGRRRRGAGRGRGGAEADDQPAAGGRRSAIVQGWSGVYNSFLLHAERAAERYGVRRTRSCEGRRAGFGRRPGGHDHRCRHRARRRARGLPWSPTSTLYKKTTLNGPATRPNTKRRPHAEPVSPMTQYVYDFTEGDKDQKALLGGKGANLAEMTKLGLPVPPGFTITTEACREYLAPGANPVICGSR